ncbi:MAG: Fic family protein [Candidatus Micrarchaeota archaeon]|nr:Fic family protein [Candidatus Micrarchaeota archaeon]
MPKLVYLTASEVKKINDLLGCRGMINEGNLDFVLAKVRDLNLSIERKAITLLYDLIIAHPFLDGNKRTAFVAMQIFLKRNGKELRHSHANEYLLKRLLYDIADNTIRYQEAENVLVKLIK